jgi:hypothetical protein
MKKLSKKSGSITVINGRDEAFVFATKDVKKFLTAYGFIGANAGRDLEEYDVYELSAGESFEIENKGLSGNRYKI